MTDDVTEDGQPTAAPPKLPYVAPFLRHLDVADSGKIPSPGESTFGSEQFGGLS